nr:uncharacterized protein LOC127322029 [Lolium perenne]
MVSTSIEPLPTSTEQSLLLLGPLSRSSPTRVYIKKVVGERGEFCRRVHHGMKEDALKHVFVSRVMDVKDFPVWIRLSYVCASNGLVLMDELLQLLPAVEIVDLSRNQFANVDNLWKCTKMQNLDLGLIICILFHP